MSRGTEKNNMHSKTKQTHDQRHVRRLTHDQLDGCACVVCGDSFRPMLPLGLGTKISSEVFRCDRAECEVSPEEVQRWITASEQPNAGGVADARHSKAENHP